MRLEQLVDAYLDHLRVERALSPHTLSAYGRDLNHFVEFAAQCGCEDPDELTLGLLGAWLAALEQQRLSARSAARRLSALRGMMRFLVREGHSEADPSALLQRPKVARRLPKPLSVNQVLQLLAQPDPTQLRGLRDRALLSLAYAAGLRVSELLGLTLGDLDLQRGVVAAFGKGRKRRLVPVGSVTLQHVEAYLRAWLSTHGPPANGLLFPGRNGRPLTRQMFWKLVRRTALQAGIPEHVHPHRLRHSFATHLLAGGADLRSVQTLLGHRDIATTEVYTLVTRDQLANVHRRTHPRG